MPSPQEPSVRIPTLDGWRGVAILLVLADHSQLALFQSYRYPSTGRHGVALFFVLSGFLITTLLAREYQNTGTLDLRRFYLRRFFRLMPCAWLYLLVVSALAHPTLQDLLGSVFFFRNFIGGKVITEHFWSLAVEEQFYLFWPSALLLLGLVRARWFAVGASFVIAAWRFFHWPNPASQFMTQYRADALFVGCAMAFLLPFVRPWLRSWMTLPLLLGLGGCIEYYQTLVPLHESVILAVLLATTAEFPDCLVSRALSAKPLAVLGAVSYSLYVWQQPFFMTAHNLRAFLIAMAALIFVAVEIYLLIERPAIKLGRALEARSLAPP